MYVKRPKGGDNSSKIERCASGDVKDAEDNLSKDQDKIRLSIKMNDSKKYESVNNDKNYDDEAEKTKNDELCDKDRNLKKRCLDSEDRNSLDMCRSQKINDYKDSKPISLFKSCNSKIDDLIIKNESKKSRMLKHEKIQPINSDSSKNND